MIRSLALPMLFCLPLLACSPTEHRERPDTGLRQTVDTCPRGDRPEAVVCNFYAYTSGITGLPSNAQQSSFSASLSVALREAMNQARVRQRQQPSLLREGSLFNSRFVHSDRFEVGRIDTSDAAAVTVEIHFEHDGQRWHDVVELRRELNRYVVHDIRYGSGDPDAPASLLALLARDDA